MGERKAIETPEATTQRRNERKIGQVKEGKLQVCPD
jgi:hypothetical protein